MSTTRSVNAQVTNPISTYRLQFHDHFTLKDLEKITPYLKQLNVKTVYASPILQASPGSQHGYDGTNPHLVNPEIGTIEELRTIHTDLESKHMLWLQDIVPNHMAFHQTNTWLYDVLEKGKKSRYASYFDVLWNSPSNERMMVPFLGGTLDECLEKKELKLDVVQNDGLPKLVLKYYSTNYPICPRSYLTVFGAAASPMDKETHTYLTNLIDHQLETIEDTDEYAKKWDEIRSKFDEALHTISFDTVINANPDLMAQITKEQHYRLCLWSESNSKMNYRRFFTVNELICINIQDAQVFNDYHRLILALTKDENIFTGLRIDHVDGLSDPTKYLDELRKATSPSCYIVVEKILEPEELLPSNWQDTIQGSTGYDFLAWVNHIFTNAKFAKDFDQLYFDLIEPINTSKEDNLKDDVHEQIYRKKKYMLLNQFGGELENLHHLYKESKLHTSADASVSEADMKSVIAEFLCHCPVYRYYSNSWPINNEAEKSSLQQIFKQIRSKTPQLEAATKQLEQSLFSNSSDQDYNQRAVKFYQRCMQFTGPLMAKGVEDTLMYTYFRYLGHNDVGDNPASFGYQDFNKEVHAVMVDRQKNWPLALSTTSTHDTKRGEDARARLNVLTDLPQVWSSIVKQWREQSEKLKTSSNPDVNDEYFIYQTVIGGFPMPGTEEDFEKRVQDYIQKALRESKRRSNWTTPNSDYENAAKKFAVEASKQLNELPFLKEFFVRVCDFGIINSLEQVILKFTCPGVPDTYQGTEFWDLSFVDPDNRRPIDYELRSKVLSELTGSEDNFSTAFWKNLWSEHRYDGRIKLWLTKSVLDVRQNHAELMRNGEYIPLTVEGVDNNSIYAFARVEHDRKEALIVLVGLHLAEKYENAEQALAHDWKGARVDLSKLPISFSVVKNVLTGSSCANSKQEILIQQEFSSLGGLPFAVLYANNPLV